MIFQDVPGVTQVSYGLCQDDTDITIHYGRSSAEPEQVPGRTLLGQEISLFNSNNCLLICDL